MSAEANEFLMKMREFCKLLFKGKLTSQQKTELCDKFNKYVPQVSGRICERVNTEYLDKEPNIIQLKGQCYVFGDIHGNLEDVYDYECRFWLSESAERDDTFVFLGDFVDRGLFSAEVSLYLLALKLIDGSKFILIRGNHEVRVVNRGYTFFTECIKKYQRNGQLVWDQINTCFERLPLACVIDRVIFCCHGGVPKSTNSLDEIIKCKKPMIDPAVECPTAHELLWNDPVESMATFTKTVDINLRQKKIDFIPNKARSTGFYFTPLAAKRFLDSNGFSHMIRAHESVDEGFKYTSDDRVLTVFSSSNYCGKTNTTACIKVNANQIQVFTIKIPNKTSPAISQPLQPSAASPSPAPPPPPPPPPPSTGPTAGSTV